MYNDSFEKLIFVYNADSGLRNMVFDSAHKIFSPSTYECSLCDITYGAFTENTIWKKFRKKSAIEMEFLHKDEFAKTYKSKFGYKFTYPIVLVSRNESLEVAVKTQELDTMKRATDLIELLSRRISILKVP